LSTKTTNYKFVKPEKTDPADITVTNVNWDKLDNALGEVKVYEVTDGNFPFEEILPSMDIEESKFIVCNVNSDSNLDSGYWLFQLTRNEIEMDNNALGRCVGASINGKSIKGNIDGSNITWCDKWDSRSQIRYSTYALEDLDDPNVFNAPNGTLYLVYEV
jgi:hypothetical protein